MGKTGDTIKALTATGIVLTPAVTNARDLCRNTGETFRPPPTPEQHHGFERQQQAASPESTAAGGGVNTYHAPTGITVTAI